MNRVVILLGLTVISFVILYIAESIYDFRLIRQRPKQTKPKKEKLPHFTIIIQTHDNESELNKCIESIACSKYPNVSIVIIDNMSGDNTRKQIRQIALQYSNLVSRVVIKRKYKPLKSKELMRRYTKGDLMLFMSSPYVLDHFALYKIAESSAANPHATHFRLRTECGNSSGWLTRTAVKIQNTFQQTDLKLSSNLAGKNGQDIFALRTQTNKSGDFSSHYVSGAIAFALCTPNNNYLPYRNIVIGENIRSIPQTLSQPKLHHIVKIVTAMQSVLFCSFIVLAVAAEDIKTLMFGWAVFSIFYAISVIIDSELSLRHKFRYTMHLIPGYLIYCSYFIANIAITATKSYWSKTTG